MRTQLWSGGFVAIACAVTVGLAAQAPSKPASPTYGKLIKLSGCIQQVPESEIGTTGAKYLLTYPRRASIKDGPTAIRYRLVVDDAKVSAHAGHRVDITGQVEEAGSDKPLSTTGTNAIAVASDAAEQARKASAANSPKLKIDTIDMVATFCP